MLLDDFTIAQRATYGWRKSEIASRACKENGAFEAKLASVGYIVEDVGASSARLDSEHKNIS